MLTNASMLHSVILCSLSRKFSFFSLLFYFLNYEKMITHLPETWKIQTNDTYSSTIYFIIFQVDRYFLIWVSIKLSKIIE